MLPAALGRYQIEAEIGKGAMGVVYRARDPRIDRVVVLKTLRLELLDTPESEAEFVERFYREARAAGKLSHPSIVTIHDVDRDEAARVDFIAMEYVPGRSLQELLASGERLLPEKAIEVASQVADALDYAHGKGVVHRDVKPGNIILRQDGVAKITDFGIARLGTSDLTKTGEYLGTPNYMSPEQIMSEGVDGRSDQFSLAIVLYQLLTGVRPFSGDNITTITYQIVHEDPVKPSEIEESLPPGASAAILKGLAKIKADRFPSCVELVAAVARGLRGPEPAAAAPDLTAYPATMVRLRRPRHVAPPPPPETGGDVSGQSLSLMHEVKRLESLDAASVPLPPAATEEASRDDESVFDVDDEATVTHERTPIPARSYMHLVTGEAAATTRLDDEGADPGPRVAAMPVEDERTRLGPPTPAPPPDDERTRLGPPTPAAPPDDERTRLGPPAPAPPPDDERTRLGPPPVADDDSTRAGIPTVGRPIPATAPDVEATRLGPPTGTFAGVAPVAAPAPRRSSWLLAAAVLVALFIMGGLAIVVVVLLRGRGAEMGPVATLMPEPAVGAAAAQPHLDAGILAFQEGRLADARSELEEARRLDPSGTTARDYLQLVDAEESRRATVTPVLVPPTEPAPPEAAPVEPTPGVEPPPTIVEALPTIVEGPPPDAVPVTPSAPTTVAPPASPETKVAAKATKPKPPPAPPRATERAPVPVPMATLTIHLEHNFKSGEIAVLVDGKESFSSGFKASKERPKLLRPFLDSDATFDVEVPAGTHDVTVRLVSKEHDVDTRGTRKLDLEEGKRCTLEVGVGRLDKDIELAKKCK